MKLKTIAAITAALTISSIGIAQAADPVKVYASHTKGDRVGDYTLDGDLSSRWVSKGDGEYIQYKFEEAVTLEAIKLAFFKGDLRKTSFRIESTDTPWSATPNWQQQELMKSSGLSNDLETFELASPVTAQFFRIVGHGFVSKWGWEGTINGITEAEFVDYQDDKPIDVVAEICGQSASTEDGENVASNVVDGDFGTRWSGNSDVANATLTLELCEEATISGVSAAFHKGDARSHDFSIEVSNDNVTWTPALPQTTTANDTLEMQDFAFEEEVSATYIRYTGYGNSGGSSWNSVTELTVCQGDECGAYVAPEFCDLYPEDVQCLDFCEVYPEDESCLSFCELNPDDSACNVNVTPLTCDEMYSCWSDVNTGSVTVSGGTINTTVDGLEDVIDGLSTAGGQEIVVTGSGDISISGKSFSKPVLIRAASIGGTQLGGVTITNSNNIALQGFLFPANDESTRVKIVSSTNIKLLRNEFDHSGITESQSTVVMTGTSQFIEIAYNEFKDKDISNRGTSDWSDKITGSFIKFQFDGTGLIAKNVHIHRNNFRNIKHYIKTGETAVSGDSDREVIAMGIADAQDEVTNNVVEYNLFDNCDGENEIITVKTSNNVFRYNTFKNSMGSLSFRLGNENIALGNYFYGEGDSANPDDDNYETGGVRTYGDGHIIRDNYMEGLTGLVWRLPILVDHGDDDDTLGSDGHQNSTNVIVQNNTLVNNLGGLTIGGTKYGNKPASISIFDNLVVGNTGELLTEVAESNNIWTGNQGYAYGDATVGMGESLSSMPATPAMYPKLTDSDVGPNAAN